MSSAPARLRAAIFRRLRHPRQLLRRPASGAETGVVLVMAVPGAARRPIARALAWVLARAVRHAPRLATLAFLAQWAADRRDAAARDAERLGLDRAVPGATRRSLAMLLAEVNRWREAARIVDSMPDESSPAVEALRAHVLFGRGQYTRALESARQAVAGGSRRAEATRQTAEGRLRVLDPEWAPDMRPHTARLEQLRGGARAGRILHLVSMSLPYKQVGYTLRSQQVGRCQQGAGLEPHFATRAGYPSNYGAVSAPADEVVDGVPYHRLAQHFPEYRIEDRLIAATVAAAVPLLERLRPAALQPASNHIQAQIALALGPAAGLPVVYEVRGFLEESWASVPDQDESQALEADRYRLNRAAETRAMLAADAVVTLSDTMRDEITSRGVPAGRLVVIPNAVDVDHFRPDPRDDGLAASLGILPGEAVVGYVSTMSPYEGIEYLVEAVAHLRRRGRQVKLLLVGDGREADAIRDRATRLGLGADVVIMPGRVPHADVRRWYSLIDVFVVPRKGNRVSRLVTPLKPYEAMALERAVVVSDLPALREMVIPGETGMTFVADDPADLATTVDTLLDDPGLRVRLGTRAREWVAAERSWEGNGRRYRDLYERLGAVSG